MTDTPMISITFFLGGWSYAMRSWTQAPRVGDEVMLNAPRKEGDDRRAERVKVPYRILRIIWGCEEPSAPRYGQAINIEIELIEGE